MSRIVEQGSVTEEHIEPGAGDAFDAVEDGGDEEGTGGCKVCSGNGRGIANGSGVDYREHQSEVAGIIGALIRKRTLFFPIATAVVLILAQPNRTVFLAGLSLVLIGAVLRVWASGYIKKSVEIALSGPFCMMRNPLYAGSFLVTLGYCVMANRPLLTAVVMAVYCALHTAAIASEECYLASVFGDQFRAYCKSVPRVFPRRPRHAGPERFSLQLVFENGEHVSVLWTAAIAAMFAVRLVF